MNGYEQEEFERLGQWLSKLNTYCPGFTLGDEASIERKTVDFINETEKIAIELKREKGDSLLNKGAVIPKLSNRIEGYVKDAEKKFQYYSQYRTILLIELDSRLDIAKEVLNGIKQIPGSSKNERLVCLINKIGAIVLWPRRTNIRHTKPVYYIGESTPDVRCITKQEVEQIIGNELQTLDLD